MEGDAVAQHRMTQFNPYNTELFCIKQEIQRFFFKLALSDLFECLWYGSTANTNIWFLSVRWLSKSDIYRRQILTYKDGPALKWLTHILMGLCIFLNL